MRKRAIVEPKLHAVLELEGYINKWYVELNKVSIVFSKLLLSNISKVHI